MVSKATPEGTLSYSYDAHGNVLTIDSSNANGASLTYAYDGLNRLASATDNRLVAQGAASGTTTYGYDPVGNLLGYSYPNGVQTAMAFDPLNRLTEMGSSKSGTTLGSYAYALGPAGNRLSVAELSGRMVNYSYDSDYKLTSEAISADPGGNNGTVSYAYDPVGNRTQQTSTL
jgi:YD repeat-containing protein